MSEDYTSIADWNSRAVQQQNVVEPATALTQLPQHFKNEASELVKLLQSYYKFLNSKFLRSDDQTQVYGPSVELSQLLSQHDIDSVTDNRYLDAIERTIAVNIPQSRSLDRERLFKIIANYYTSRGSEESIHSFFRIFFNELVSIVYPRELLFSTSDSTVNSAPSGKNKIRDSYRWQEFSYIIRSGVPNKEWRYEYQKYIHPAGFKFFIAFAIEIFKQNDWYQSDYSIYISEWARNENVNIDDYWKHIDWDRFYGMDSPLFQPNVDLLTQFLTFLKANDDNKHYITNVRNIRGVSSDYLKAFWIFLSIQLILQNRNTMHSIWRESWKAYEKFIDRGLIGEYATCSLYDAQFGSYNRGSGPQFNTLNSHNVRNRFSRSYLEDRCEIQRKWYDTDQQPGSSQYEIFQPSSGVELRTDYNQNTAISWKNSFVFATLSESNIPQGSYLTPGGFNGYYFNENDYYQQPI